jgi:ABC-type multidrug transport system ATPase subunit
VPESVIETVNLSKRFGKTLAVDAISFRVERGQVFGFLGPNGSGKTTTIGMIVGIIRPTSGGVRLFGSDSGVDTQRMRRRMGGTLEQPSLYPYLTGWDNLKIVAAIKGFGRAEIEAALAAVDMLGAAVRECRTYSLGMKQRLALAAAMLGDPELLILDEPTNGLDPEGMHEIRALIARLAGLGKTIFLSSHLLSEVERICSHVAIVKNGRLLECGPVHRILERAPVVRLTAPDTNRLVAAVERYAQARWVRREDEAVIAELTDDDRASLTRYLSGQEIYLSELSPMRASLEEAFIEVTQAESTIGENLR